VGKPTHVKAIVGYPIEKILAACDVHQSVRVIAGGALTGEQWPEGQVGLDAETSSLTVLPDDPPREFLGFARPGWDRQSVHRCYLSRLRKPFTEALTTKLRGERRACVACAACEDVCPAGIWPHLIHKYLYEDALEDAEAARIDLCVECGLCSYVCPSKIELLEQFRQAKAAIARELAEAAEEAKAEAEAAEGQEVSA
jgi:Na+-transporting NADH:ubiquinone oxidoreductase subunit A